MLIDVHGHIGTFGPRETSDEHLSQYLTHCGVDRLLIADLDAAPAGKNADEPDANLRALAAARANPKLTALYAIRPGRPDSNLHAMCGALDTEPFAGVFFAPGHGTIAVDDERLDRYTSVIQRLGRPMLVLCGRDELSRAERVLTLARRMPRLPIILAAGEAAAWAPLIDVVQRARKRDDATLFAATSHATAEEVAKAVVEVGEAAILFGSDAVVRGAEHAAWVDRTIEAMRQLVPPAAFRAITAENAVRLIRAKK